MPRGHPQSSKVFSLSTRPQSILESAYVAISNSKAIINSPSRPELPHTKFRRHQLLPTLCVAQRSYFCMIDCRAILLATTLTFEAIGLIADSPLTAEVIGDRQQMVVPDFSKQCGKTDFENYNWNVFFVISFQKARSYFQRMNISQSQKLRRNLFKFWYLT